jgi:hypothetical protein
MTDVDDSSFLPQDKVTEFARMTPQQLLKETQRAAGDSNLTAWHTTLIKEGKELRKEEEVCYHSQSAILILSVSILANYPSDSGANVHSRASTRTPHSLHSSKSEMLQLRGMLIGSDRGSRSSVMYVHVSFFLFSFSPPFLSSKVCHTHTHPPRPRSS